MEYMGKEKILSYIVKDRKKAFNTIVDKSFLSLDYLDNLNVESFEEEVIEDIGRFDLLELLNKLDYKYRRVLYLYYYEDFKIKEISEILKTKEETIKTWLRRGKIYLKKELLKNGREEYFG
ncbi:MAG: RNA polymerase sigma factor [Clostridium chrysemydis]|uniref:RNA polymerase sigma factor n=1 Tax=Clostridium TaxID=1485 RepID=UPI0021537CF7|nr:sigma-70 family RNA polymerase sigma factor [Clostridium sp. LY3-2]MCR6515628.1 sigma-70 family RNA polymerase sigma factor [Clostridium sp. LY3-2]